MTRQRREVRCMDTAITVKPEGETLIEGSRKVLDECLEVVRNGLAKDLLTSILDGNASETDCDTLFRVCVLDHGMDVETAESVYSAAMDLVET